MRAVRGETGELRAAPPGDSAAHLRAFARAARPAGAATGAEALPRRDPAPTRWHYRYQRLMLTPIFRIMLRVITPALLAFGAFTLWYAQPANRQFVADRIEAVTRSIETRPEFMVSGLQISGASEALRLAVEDLVEVSFPVSSFDLDLEAMQDEIAALTAVRRVTVRIRPGGTLDIAIEERVPVAVWRYADGLRLVDAEGVLTGMIEDRAARADLPLIAGDGARERIAEALALFAAAAPIAPRVRGLVRMGERRWDLILDRDQRILLPETDPVPALERVIALQEAQEVLERDVIAVDMRNPVRPTVRLGQPAMNILRNTQVIASTTGLPAEENE